MPCSSCPGHLTIRYCSTFPSGGEHSALWPNAQPCCLPACSTPQSGAVSFVAYQQLTAEMRRERLTMSCRGVTVAIVYQLSTADCCKDSINMTGWFMGGGPYEVGRNSTVTVTGTLNPKL
jgi:hypothetical protein